MNDYWWGVTRYAVIGWLSATALALAYWLGAEGEVPGQHYPNPIIPCLYCGELVGIPAGMFVRLVVIVVRQIGLSVACSQREVTR